MCFFQVEKLLKCTDKFLRDSWNAAPKPMPAIAALAAAKSAAASLAQTQKDSAVVGASESAPAAEAASSESAPAPETPSVVITAAPEEASASGGATTPAQEIEMS